jgi:hypothetical protein
MEPTEVKDRESLARFVAASLLAALVLSSTGRGDEDSGDELVIYEARGGLDPNAVVRLTIWIGGRAMSEVNGEVTGIFRVSASRMREIEAGFEDAGFLDLPGEISGETVYDAPTTTITYRGHTVRVVYGAPSGALARAIGPVTRLFVEKDEAEQSE